MRPRMMSGKEVDWVTCLSFPAKAFRGSKIGQSTRFSNLAPPAAFPGCQRSIEKIREFHPHLSGRTILRRTAELKLTSWNLPWTEVDKGYLLDHAREFPVADLARRFRRTQNAVYLLLWKNGESGKFQDGYTRRDLAELVHVSPRKVSRWVRLGWLTLYQGRVKDRSLRRFLEGHSDEINAERLDRDVRFWLLSLGFHEDCYPFGAVV